MDCHTTFVEDYGDIAIEILIRHWWEHSVLADVLFMLIMQRNLFSVSSMALKNVNTLYCKTSCQMRGDGIVLMEGTLEGMLCKFHTKAIPSSIHANLTHSLGISSTVDDTHSLEICSKDYAISTTKRS